MELVVRAFPLKEGKEQELKEFAKEVSTNRAEATGKFYGRYGAERETWHLQETPWGKWVICVTQFSGRPAEEAGQAYGASTAEFDAWFKEQVEALSGVNPETDPLGPPTEPARTRATGAAPRPRGTCGCPSIPRRSTDGR